MVDVQPENDEIEHVAGAYCPCEPSVEYVSAETGLDLRDGPLVVHNAADGREAVERGIGELLSLDRGWSIVRC